MDPKIPNEDEKKRLNEIYRYHRSSELYMLSLLYPTLILIGLTYFLDKHPVAVFAIVMVSVIMLLGIIYLIIKRTFKKRCPRCSMGGIPPTPLPPNPGTCPRCGMYLDPSYKEEKEDKKETSILAQKWMNWKNKIAR